MKWGIYWKHRFHCSRRGDNSLYVPSWIFPCFFFVFVFLHKHIRESKLAVGRKYRIDKRLTEDIWCRFTPVMWFYTRLKEYWYITSIIKEVMSTDEQICYLIILTIVHPDFFSFYVACPFRTWAIYSYPQHFILCNCC